MSGPLLPHSPGDTTLSPPPTGPSLLGPHLSRLAWLVAVCAVLALIVYIMAQVRTVTIPLLVAYTIAYLLNPLVDWVQRHGMRRSNAIALLLSLGLIGLGGLMLLVGPFIWSELLQVPARLQQLLSQVRPWALENLHLSPPTSVQALVEALQSELGALNQADVGVLARYGSDLLRWGFGGTVSLVASLIGLFLMPFMAYTMLRDFHLLGQRVRDLVPVAARSAVNERLAEIDATLSSFVRGQLMVGTILAVLYAIGFSLVGVPLGLLLGILTGLGNMLPYMGTVLGGTTASILCLLNWQGVSQLALLYSVFVINHTLDAWVITPHVVGGSMGLSPFSVIVAILVFGELFGLFGVLAAVPLAAILKILGRVALMHYRASTFYAGSS